MPTAFDFVKKNVRSAANAIPSMIDQGRTDLANQQVAANNAAMQAPIQAPEVKAPSNPAQDALNNEMLGRLMRPGRGRRKGQMVTSGGKYSGRTVDEIYGKLQKSGSGAGGGLRTGSLSEGSGIDWLKANRTSGKALARQEANVGATGDRFKAAPKPVARPAMTQAPAVVDTKPMNMSGATPVSPQATNPAPSSPTGLDISGVSKLYKNAEAAVNSPEYKQRQQDRSVAPFMQGAMSPQKPFSAPGQQSPKRTPEPAWGPIKQPDPKTVRWAEQMRQNVDSATKQKPGIADTFLNLPAPTPNIRPLSSQQQAIVQGKPSPQPVVTSPVAKAMSAPPPTLAQKAPMTPPATPMAASKPQAPDVLTQSLGQAEAAKRRFIGGAKEFQPTPRELGSQVKQNTDVYKNFVNTDLKKKNPGVKPALIPGYLQ